MTDKYAGGSFKKTVAVFPLYIMKFFNTYLYTNFSSLSSKYFSIIFLNIFVASCMKTKGLYISTTKLVKKYF